MARRIIEIFFDINRAALRDSKGQLLRIENFPFITFRANPIVNLQLVTDSSNTAFTGLGASQVYIAAIDDDFDSATALMVQTLNAGINAAGHFTSNSSGNANPLQGQVSIKLNANTTGFQSKIGTKAKLLTTGLELIVKDGSDVIEHVFSIPFNTRGLRNDSGLIPTQLSNNFEKFNDPITGKQCIRWFNDDGEVLRTDCPAGV